MRVMIFEGFIYSLELFIYSYLSLSSPHYAIQHIISIEILKALVMEWFVMMESNAMNGREDVCAVTTRLVLIIHGHRHASIRV